MYGADALVGAVRLSCGRPDEAEVSNDEILAHAQFVLDEFAAVYRPPSLSGTEVTAVSAFNDTVVLSEDVLHVRSGFVNGARLKEIDFDHYARLVSTSFRGAGTPVWYCQVASADPRQPIAIKLVPTPSSDVQITWFVIRRHPILTLAPAPTPILLPPHLIGFLVEETASRVLAAMQKREEAAAHRQVSLVDERAVRTTSYGMSRDHKPSRMRSLFRRRR
ncbi:MAG: hypothetical protein QXN56_01375 [Candidatus Hadarchaeum sp.]